MNTTEEIVPEPTKTFVLSLTEAEKLNLEELVYTVLTKDHNFYSLRHKINALVPLDNASALRPTGSRIVVKERAALTQVGGVLLVNPAKNNTLRGTVIAAGPGSYTSDGTLVPTCVVPGDDVIYQTFVGIEIENDKGEKFMIINDRDILAVVNADAAIEVKSDIVESIRQQANPKGDN
jgi:chaperonin GroES